MIGKETKYPSINQIPTYERCNGQRLKEEALCVKINGLNISQVTEKSILEAKNWFDSLQTKLDKRQLKIAEHILKEINERLNFLLNVGLDYLTLSKVQERCLVESLKE